MNPLQDAKEVLQDIAEVDFINSFSEIQKQVNQTAHDKGWYDSPLRQILDECSIPIDAMDLKNYARQELQNLEDSRRMALIHSEVSEALENIRHRFTPDDKIPKFKGVEAELADVIIRIMDVAQERGWRVAEAVIAKANYNQTRSFRHGNKAC